MNVLVDTSVWADHFRAADEGLIALLEAGRVLVHPFVIGELALGNLRNRSNTLAALSAIPSAVRATDGEAMTFMDAHGLPGSGVGLIDVHLLASTRLTADATLWTRDKRLTRVAAGMGFTYSN